MCFAPYCTIFGHKRPQKGCKCQPLEINIHFVAFTHCPFLASKQTFARIDFLRQVGQLGTKWALMALNFLLKILLFLHYCHVLPQTNGAEFWILSYLCSVLCTWEEWLPCFCITKIKYSYQYWFTIGFCSPWFCITKIIYSYQYWFTIGVCSPWFCVTKTTNASQLIGRLEVKPFLNLKIY